MIRRCTSLIILSLWLGFIAALAFHSTTEATSNFQAENNCVACHRREAGKAGEVVRIYEASIHRQAQVSCEGCHGGDSSQTDKGKAHAEIIGKPDSNATLVMCGQCHRQPLALFKGSRHFPDQQKKARLDCAECHGVHSIGSLAAEAEWITFCAGCHGLEYLPELPKEFQAMLTLSDELRASLHRLEAKAITAPAELVQSRKNIRRQISEIVHPTDLKGGLEKIPALLQSGAKLKTQLEALLNSSAAKKP